MIVVYRRVGGQLEYLVLHRGHAGPDWEEDWAWGPPSGVREPGETVEECAARELFEETGLQLQLRSVPHTDEDWLVYAAEVPPNVGIRLSDEHDRGEWLPADEALKTTSPAIV